MNVNLFNNNLALATDSYKVSHWLQFPEGMENSFYYGESRGSTKDLDTSVLQSAGMVLLINHLSTGITLEQVEYANSLYKMHFGMDIFNYDGWKSIAVDLEGKLPIRIRCVPEGLVIPTKNVQYTVEHTVDGYGWLAGYLETLLLRGVWYPSTVATISYQHKQVIQEALIESSDLDGEDFDTCLNFRLHDFGARGVSSGESAAIGGLAHTYNFTGSDTIEGIELARKLYGTDMSAFSIAAREHSTTVVYLREGEYEAFMNSVRNFGGGLFAVVIDSYSTKAALKWLLTNKEFLTILKEKGGQCVLRPDSGCPIEMVKLCCDMVAKYLGFTVNSKGYKVLNPLFRIIQGDGVDLNMIKRIITWVVHAKKYSQENFNYGEGGGLLQHCNRDWLKYAMKMSAAKVNGEWRGVYKEPETDPSKRSKEGRLDLIVEDGEYKTIVLDSESISHPDSVLVLMFENGDVLYKPTLEEVRANTLIHLQ